ncbi:leucine-rich repeat domain-containing protein [Solirubrum puertoriconensis]|uniref:Disease resistance R13L4/SHOC-2-like LRR domain-containing protein n=1 Tax=Solirubrum puertoriconensis TaxID=1751427 RepID=A0A9X0HND9_SOLP1|nr:leucine-rich repeat domain-containing protein [Solirubrum puertoriconensis]KUG09120.1 hypothetical protein ASU33_20090 [Solirubrum puertoriconensis]
MERNFYLSSARKSIFVLTFLLIKVGSSLAQDTIYKVDGDSIEGTIKSASKAGVIYTSQTQAKDSTNRTIASKDIRKIMYAHGRIEYFQSATAASDSTRRTSLQRSVPRYDVIHTTYGSHFEALIHKVDDQTITYSCPANKELTTIKLADVSAVHFKRADSLRSTLGTLTTIAKNSLKRDTTQARLPATTSGVLIEKGIADGDSTNLAADITPSDSAQWTKIEVENVEPIKVKLALLAPASHKANLVAFKGSAASSLAAKTEDKKYSQPSPALRSGSRNPDAEGSSPSIPRTGYADPDSVYVAVIRGPHLFSSQQKVDPQTVELLNLHNSGLDALPASVKAMPKLKAINLSNNHFKAFPTELFDLPNLEYVWLDNVGLQSLILSPDLITKLLKSRIAFISVCNNTKLSKVNSLIFTLPELQEIRLKDNKISQISLTKKADLSKSKIHKIDLSGNKLTAAPVLLTKLPTLRDINLSNNTIVTLDDKFMETKTLRKVSIASNPLAGLPASIVKLKDLNELDLANTMLIGLPDSIGTLNNLTKLTLPSSVLYFPKSFSKLKKLTDLTLKPSLSNSKLAGFPTEITQCTRLKRLDVSGISISAFPKEIGNLQRLEYLYAQRCELNSLPEELFKLPRLKVLDVSRNYLKVLPANFGDLKSLREISLEAQPIESNSLLALRRGLPRTAIRYLDADFGAHFESAAIPESLIPGFQKLYAACDAGEPNAFFELGNFFATNRDYGYAVKAYKVVAENASLQGTGKAMLCQMSIANIYDDINNVKPYSSPYKRKLYIDYDDYLKNSSNNRAFLSYLQISRIRALDEVGKEVRKQAMLKASVISNEIAENLEKIYEANNEEIERLISTAGGMKNLSATGEKVMSDGLISNSQAGVAIGGAANLIGALSASSKDNKAERYKAMNLRLQSEIINLKQQAHDLLPK